MKSHTPPVPWYVRQFRAICEHPEKVLRVVEAVVTCELVEEVCTECGEVFNWRRDCT